MLFWSHALAAVADGGKVALYQGNPLAINFAEWMAFFRYLVPSVKYWLFDKQRLRCEHLERINEQGWQEIETQTSRIMRIVTAEDFPILALACRGHPIPYEDGRESQGYSRQLGRTRHCSRPPPHQFVEWHHVSQGQRLYFFVQRGQFRVIKLLFGLAE